ncbi:MAG: hypothetical protein HZB98_05030 [Bacteroidia bacterium]|nr:hypothetical protein [Bacteroidia bacterium]
MKIKEYIFLLTIVLIFSCEDSKYNTNCDNCLSDEPEQTTIIAELEEYGTSGTLVKLYEGRLEDNVVVDSIHVYRSSKYEKRVSLNRMYTVAVSYIINNKLYTVINSTTPRVKYTETMCEEPCYFVYDRMMDLRLKYTK